MIKLSIISPLDQPIGTRRLLQDLKTALSDARFDNFRIIVAYAKTGPIYRLQDHLEKWKQAGKKLEAIVGVDQQGTSVDALRLLMSLFDKVYVTQQAGITFHPKIYLFKGSTHAHAFIGSNNLTVGGTEKNFESAVQIELDVPADNGELVKIEKGWNDLLPSVCAATSLLTPVLLAQLVADGIVIEESKMRLKVGSGSDASLNSKKRSAGTGITVKPESPLPKAVMANSTPRSRTATTRSASPTSPVIPVTPSATVSARGLAIQIKPHHNGEIFLSVTAALQDPTFFSWPFTGMTTPKKTGNPSYPQLDPDPVVNITVFGAGGLPVLQLPGYALNTVYYATKSEIRITASPLVGIAPDYSVMIIERSTTPGITYEIAIHRPDSPDYASWVAACNQSMPGGGSVSRKFGWF